MDQLFRLLLLADIASEMDKETPAGPGIVEDDGRHIDPDALSGTGLHTHVEIRNLDLLPRALHHAASFVADVRAERTSALQDFKAGLIPDLFCREAEETLSSLIPGVNLSVVGNDKSGIRGPLQHCKQLAFKHVRVPSCAD